MVTAADRSCRFIRGIMVVKAGFAFCKCEAGLFVYYNLWYLFQRSLKWIFYGLFSYAPLQSFSKNRSAVY